MCECAQSCLTVYDLMGCSPHRLLFLWNFLGTDTGVGCQNPGDFSRSRDQTPVSHTSPASQADSLLLSHQGSLLASNVLSKCLVSEGVYTTFSGKCRTLCTQSLPPPGPSGLCSRDSPLAGSPGNRAVTPLHVGLVPSCST